MTHIYDFISKNISEKEVKSIIQTAYSEEYVLAYKYEPRVSKDGYVATCKGDGDKFVMSVTRLEQAALALNIKVEIYSALNSALSDFTVAGSAYSVNITMSATTASTLQASGFILYGFKAVKSTTGGGSPVVWFQTGTYSANTLVSWEVDYETYTSNSQIIPGGNIVASFTVGTNLGQQLNVDSPVGTGTVVSAPNLPASIGINNQTTTQFTCGIGQKVAGVSSPMCAVPLYGQMLDVFTPIEKVLFVFATVPYNTGTVIIQAFGPSILIDLTGVTTRTVSYDLNTGWTANASNAWVTLAPAGTDLVPLLLPK